MSDEAKTALLLGVIFAGVVAAAWWYSTRRERAAAAAGPAQLARTNWTLEAQGFA